MTPKMFSFLALTVLSTVVYHLAQKTTPEGAHPMLALAVSYAAASIICLAFIPIFPLQGGLVESLHKLNLSSLLLGLAVVGIETGYLLSYRAGWQISRVSLVGNTAVAILLLPIGFLLFSEKLTLQEILGVLACLVGLFLLTLK
jgi:drug/metabolite transporter (DMT)-like permease